MNCLDRRIKRRNNGNNKIHAALKWLLVDNFIRNNQPKTSGKGGGANG